MFDSQDFDSSILIVGAGPIGLYTALLLTKMGISVRIIDKKEAKSTNTNKSFLWSPRSLQLLSNIGITETMLQNGYRHWKFETFTNATSNTSTGGGGGGGGHHHGSHAATTTDHQSFRVWENEATEFNWSLSYECNKVCDALIDALAGFGVKVDYQHELIKLDDFDSDDFHHHHHHPHLPQKKSIMATIQNNHGIETYWKSKFVIGADGKNSFVRHKLGIAQRSIRTNGVFYTMEATVSTNFPGTRMSVVRKGDNAIFIVAHGEKMYLMFEHQPRWSHLTIDDPVPLSKAQRHIKSVIDPYQIEFTKVHSYFSWSAETKACEEYTVDRHYFLVGGAAQSICPPGLLSTNFGLEQAQNLCWKLYLHLHQRATPLLLDTYEEESKSKLDDIITASQAFIQLISNRSLTAYDDDDDHNDEERKKAMNSKEQTYKLEKSKPSLVGETPYQMNLINLCTASTFSLATTSDSNTITAMTQMLQNDSNNNGIAGSLAQNGKLKPYTLIQILLSQSNLFSTNNMKSYSNLPNASSHHGLDDIVSPSSSPVSQSPPPLTQLNNKNLINGQQQRPRSLSTSSSSTSIGWSFSKLQHVTKKAIRYYGNNNNNSNNGRQQQQQQNGKNNEITHQGSQTSFSTTIAAPPKSGITLNTSAERWRQIRANYFQLLDRIRWQNSEVNFTVLIFCRNIHDDEKCLTTLRKLRRYLDSNHSFIHRYETQHQQSSASHYYNHPQYQLNNSNNLSSLAINTTSTVIENNPRESSSSHTSSHRSSFSYSAVPRGSLHSIFSNNRPSSPTSTMTSCTTIARRNSHDQSLSQQQQQNISSPRPSFSSCFEEDGGRGSNSLDYQHQQQQDRFMTSPRLFSFLYITTSNKNEVIKCLNTTPSSIIHAAFPFGLDKVYLDHDHQCHKAYNVSLGKNKSPTMVVIRPDGYIGTRVKLNDDQDVGRLDTYFDSFLRPHVDMTSAAAVVADDYDC
ncbi:FAD binding domain-containing protein [Cunninghamella echinulata]|nr:FAD binding domain-containing protein [Cunninghamella echinulata]